jgi:hypothetical protein
VWMWYFLQLSLYTGQCKSEDILHKCSCISFTFPAH